ncbi:MAG: hypothetical protein RQ714_01190 [Nitrosomonas sp.]|nr:hypothetical protein [Nitrosomonas sp.]
MGALIFYTFIFFVGYFLAHGFALLTRRDILGRRGTGLACVLIMAVMHGYKILSTAPPAGHEDTSAQVLSYYVIFPVSVITVVLLYLRWRDQNDDDSDNNH